MSLKTKISIALAVSALFTLQTASATNGYFTHGLGVKNKGMAGAGTAAPAETISAASNPAAAVMVDEDWEVGLSLFSPRRSYKSGASQANGNGGAFTIGPNDIDSGREYFPIPYVGKAWRLDDNSAMAVNFYGRGGMNTEWGGGTASLDPDGPGPAPVTTLQGTYGAGNAGVIDAGGVQWMTAGRGIIHSEMPQQSAGLLAGFQLWINLPSTHKMTPPAYQERTAAEIPIETLKDGTRVKIIAGQTRRGTQGVIENGLTEPVFWDVSLLAGGCLDERLTPTHNAFIYVIAGELTIGVSQDHLVTGQLAILGSGDGVVIEGTEASRFLLIAAKPLNEPVERAGPFVMNTRAEIDQAFADYRQGRLA